MSSWRWRVQTEVVLRYYTAGGHKVKEWKTELLLVSGPGLVPGSFDSFLRTLCVEDLLIMCNILPPSKLTTEILLL